MLDAILKYLVNKNEIWATVLNYLVRKGNAVSHTEVYN